MSPQRLKQKELEEARTKQLKLKTGCIIDNRWKLCRILGAGGNGTVWECVDVNTDTHYAIKILKHNYPKALQRFLDEIYVMKDMHLSGVLPIIYSAPIDVTLGSENNLCYYVMPLAQPIGQILRQPIEEKVRVILQLFDVLKSLHERKIAHRDIKLDNILFYEGQYVFSDFGLVTYEGKTKITGHREALGGLNAFDPRSTLAIKLSIEDMQKIDICEFAKVIWTILTGRQDVIIFGQYRKDSSFALSKYMSGEIMALGDLEELLEACTEIEKPLFYRPDICCMQKCFQQWWRDNQDPIKRRHGCWKDIINKLRHQTRASVYTWEDQDEIKKVKELITKYGECFVVKDGNQIVNYTTINNEETSIVKLDVNLDIVQSTITLYGNHGRDHIISCQ